jgi:diadenosine tetraphosphate (Ap4A) HIT family hydrolase
MSEKDFLEKLRKGVNQITQEEDPLVSKEISFLNDNLKIRDNENAVLTYNFIPMQDGHMLAVLKNEEVSKLSEVSDEELRDLSDIVFETCSALEEQTEKISVFLNQGKIAGQTVDKIHIHIIPHKEYKEEENLVFIDIPDDFRGLEEITVDGVSKETLFESFKEIKELIIEREDSYEGANIFFVWDKNSNKLKLKIKVALRKEEDGVVNFKRELYDGEKATEEEVDKYREKLKKK